MDRHYATAEQYERWFIRDCARCGRRGNFAVRWPDGHVCRTCHDRVLRTRGTCPGCGVDRVLPGLRPGDGAAICTTCTTCAGFAPSVACSRCGQEGKLHARRLCTRCALDARLAELLDNGTGRIRPELVPLADLLTTMPNPLTGLTWLYSRPGRAMSPADFLRGLGSGEIALTHEAFAGLQPWRSAIHLQELLMKCGVLPAIDKQILLFERWLAEHLTTISDPRHRKLIRQFATWEVLPWIRNRASRGPLPHGTRGTAGTRISQATSFLAWLATQALGLADVGQAQLDAWLATHGNHHRQALKPFLRWAAHNRTMPALHVPAGPVTPSTPITQHRRISLLRKLITDEHSAALRTRVAAILILLYAQPLSRILRLTLDDIGTTDDGTVALRFGDPPTPVPAHVAELLLRLRDERANMHTATNPNARWLFPVRRADQPLTIHAIGPLIRQAGIPAARGRLAALRQLVLQAPAPVIAQILGFHQHTTQRAHTNAAGPWNRYATSHEQ